MIGTTGANNIILELRTQREISQDELAEKVKHGSGGLHLRSDGRWEGRVVIGYDDSGLPKTKNVLA